MGAKVVEPGWDVKRSVYMEDVATTIYSALGIDWTKVIEEHPRAGLSTTSSRSRRSR